MILCSNSYLFNLLLISTSTCVCNGYFFDNWEYNTRLDNVTRIRRQAPCGSDQIRCGSGECLSEDVGCDGKTDCPDRSDETAERCQAIPCYGFTFKCNYGACIDRRFVCDRKQDCADGSDEVDCNLPSTGDSKCPNTSDFQCKSGQCIDEENLCDGKPDCNDNSDETREVCGGLTCPKFSFRCDYGACLPSRVRCNGRKECFDGSDEYPSLCEDVTPATPFSTSSTTTTKRPSITKTPTTAVAQVGSCVVPNYPENGKFIIGGTTVPPPGERIPNYGVIFIECKKRFKPYPNVVFMLCNQGTWSPPNPPECSPVCSNLTSSLSTEINCTLDGMQVPCTDPVAGTVARYSCNSYYDDVSIDQPPQIICKDGSWDYQFAQCVPFCGKKSAQGVTNIINANRTKKGDYPWQVGLYKTSDNDHICGGSILTERIVISAAHCIADYQGNPFPKENYWVAAGKYYRVLGDERDKDTEQKTAIMKIYKAPRYRGTERNFESDLALLIVQQRFKFSAFVQPICIDWRNNYEKEQLIDNRKGIVVGWGYTKEGEAPAEELKQLEVPFISDAQCFDQVPAEFKPYLTRDKICAGFLEKNTSVCQGDSGGGLVFYRNQTEKFYLRGIVSTSPRRELSCDSRQYGAYTKVSDHLDFIQDIEIMYRERNKV